MEDYKQKLQELILKFFSPISVSGGYDLMTTCRVLELVTGVLPQEPISEHDVYEVLTALSFEIVKEKDEDDIERLFWVMNRIE